MQSIDFSWLASQGFRFHHYRPPGHGDTAPPASAAEGAPVDLGSAEFVYYCWPGPPETDMIPSYATGVEGATALMFSPDETKVLLVWERGHWTTAGGAVNPGECKLETLIREVYEEVNVKVDEAWDGVRYLGGWSAGRARDNVINDNFSAFAVRLQSEEFEPDCKEIHEARWFEWRSLLNAWIHAGRPGGRKFETDLGLARKTDSEPNAERNILQVSMLMWLDAFASGHGLRVTSKTSEQGPYTARKVCINCT